MDENIKKSESESVEIGTDDYTEGAPRDENKFLKWGRYAVASILVLSVLYISGVYQYFLFRTTPDDARQERIESVIGGRMLNVPLSIFIFKGAGRGSLRTRENVRNMVDNADHILGQANLTLVIKNIFEVKMSDDELRLFYEDHAKFARSLDNFDPFSINVFLVKSLDGVNGIAFGGLHTIAVADYTTVFDFRTLAHEIGHILGLTHVADDKSYLMYKGANGTALSGEEIIRARRAAMVYNKTDMKLKSKAFEHSTQIPKKYTCDGDNISPPLEISDVPNNAQSLVLIMDDPDVPTFVKDDGIWDHWVVYNIPVGTSVIEENEPPGGVVGLNTSGKAEYMGPCPPDKEHRYFFKLYALDRKLELEGRAAKKDVLNALRGHIVAQTELIGLYKRAQ